MTVMTFPFVIVVATVKTGTGHEASTTQQHMIVEEVWHTNITVDWQSAINLCCSAGEIPVHLSITDKTFTTIREIK